MLAILGISISIVYAVISFEFGIALFSMASTALAPEPVSDSPAPEADYIPPADDSAESPAPDITPSADSAESTEPHATLLLRYFDVAHYREVADWNTDSSSASL